MNLLEWINFLDPYVYPRPLAAWRLTYCCFDKFSVNPDHDLKLILGDAIFKFWLSSETILPKSWLVRVAFSWILQTSGVTNTLWRSICFIAEQIFWRKTEKLKVHLLCTFDFRFPTQVAMLDILKSVFWFQNQFFIQICFLTLKTCPISNKIFYLIIGLGFLWQNKTKTKTIFMKTCKHLLSQKVFCQTHSTTFSISNKIYFKKFLFANIFFIGPTTFTNT